MVVLWMIGRNSQGPEHGDGDERPCVNKTTANHYQTMQYKSKNLEMFEKAI